MNAGYVLVPYPYFAPPAFHPSQGMFSPVPNFGLAPPLSPPAYQHHQWLPFAQPPYAAVQASQDHHEYLRPMAAVGSFSGSYSFNTNTANTGVTTPISGVVELDAVSEDLTPEEKSLSEAAPEDVAEGSASSARRTPDDTSTATPAATAAVAAAVVVAAHSARRQRPLSFNDCRQQRSPRPIQVPAPIPGDSEPGPRQLIVNYLALDIDSQDLYDLFAPYGEVEMARVATDVKSKRSIGFGFVYMKHHVDAHIALAQASGRVLLGKRVRVSYATPQRPLLPESQSSGAVYGPSASAHLLLQQ